MQKEYAPVINSVTREDLYEFPRLDGLMGDEVREFCDACTILGRFKQERTAIGGQTWLECHFLYARFGLKFPSRPPLRPVVQQRMICQQIKGIWNTVRRRVAR